MIPGTNEAGGKPTMRTMTSEDLVRAVTELSTPAARLVPGSAIEAWCRSRRIDTGEGRHNRFFEATDHGEAATLHRLAKFKKGCHQNADVAWCLVERATPELVTRERTQGWRRLPFDRSRGRWRWQCR
jgi:hypothetical protein